MPFLKMAEIVCTFCNKKLNQSDDGCSDYLVTNISETTGHSFGNNSIAYFIHIEAL